jgi:hypothetical protein
MLSLSSIIVIIIIVLEALIFEFRGSWLLGRNSFTWVMSLVLLALIISWTRPHHFCLGQHGSGSSYLCLSHCGNGRHIPPSPTYWLRWSITNFFLAEPRTEILLIFFFRVSGIIGTTHKFLLLSLLILSLSFNLMTSETLSVKLVYSTNSNAFTQIIVYHTRKAKS